MPLMRDPIGRNLAAHKESDMGQRQEKWIGPQEWRTTPPLAKRDYPKQKRILKVHTVAKWVAIVWVISAAGMWLKDYMA